MEHLINAYLAEELTLQEVVDIAVGEHGMSPAHVASLVMDGCEVAHREG